MHENVELYTYVVKTIAKRTKWKYTWVLRRRLRWGIGLCFRYINDTRIIPIFLKITFDTHINLLSYSLVHCTTNKFYVQLQSVFFPLLIDTLNIPCVVRGTFDFCQTHSFITIRDNKVKVSFRQCVYILLNFLVDLKMFWNWWVSWNSYWSEVVKIILISTTCTTMMTAPCVQVQAKWCMHMYM